MQVVLEGNRTRLSLYDVARDRAGNYCKKSAHREPTTTASTRGIGDICR
ncbi:hypothetical protein [Caballeronia ptereochthonis]|nr:hypothetical protein [Caballeronia ptereochthonis]